MLGLKRGIVELCDHDKAWEQNATQTIEKLKVIFGNVATDIQHVGSTSIVNIKAKPIIDIAGIEQRSRVLHTEWLKKINCPIIIVDGAKPINEILKKVGLNNG